MLHTVPVEVWLAAAYALFLMMVAAVLERLAMRAHQRSEEYQVAGFKFHADFDRWECPTGQLLHRSDIDYGGRVTRYKAPAHACNVCRIKPECTDSENGREIERHMDSWLSTEVGRFHRGISLALLLLAALLLIIEAARYRQPQAELVLGSLFVPAVIASSRLLSAFFNSAR